MELSLKALTSIYLQDDSQLSGAELQNLIARSRTPDAEVSRQALEFANPLDSQVQSIANGRIPGAEQLFTAGDLSRLRQRVTLANDPAYARAFAAKVDQATLAPSRAGNDVKFFVDGNQAFPELHRLINSATKTIDMDYYMFEDNSTGQTVAQELIDAAKRGVRVNVMCDALMAPLSVRVLTRLRANGVNVQLFHNGFDVPQLHPSASADHRKLLLVDGEVAMTGGMNLGEAYEKYWHDVMVQVRGPAVLDLYHTFTMNWTASGGAMPNDALALARERARPVGDASVAIHETRPPKHQIADGLFAAIDAAQDHIYINSPYYIDQTLVDHLKAAARRGVHVVAIIPVKTDIPPVSFINETRVNEMLAAGIDVRTINTLAVGSLKHNAVQDYFDHAKLITIDGVWSAVGTANASARSMWKNQEVNVAVSSATFARDVERRFFGRDALSGRVEAGQAIKYEPVSVPFRKAIIAVSHYLPF